jgi:rhamnosyltransferase
MRHLNVCAGVTAYHPGDGFHERINSIAAQVALVIVVNNSDSDSLSRDNFAENVEIRFNKNIGAVAGALNIVLREARRLKFDYLVTFDQDSVVPPDLITGLISASRDTGAHIVGPNYFNSATKAPGRFNLYRQGMMISKWFPKPAGIHETYCVITSGMLVSLKDLPHNLDYRDDFLVDLVDVEFCLRARSLGLRVAVNTDVSMSHALGNRLPGSSRFSATNYGPFRRYIATRNRIVLWRQYLRAFTLFVVTDIALALADLVRTLLIERGRRALINAYYTGVRDGIHALRKPK